MKFHLECANTGHFITFDADNNDEFNELLKVAGRNLWSVSHPEEFDKRMAELNRAIEAQNNAYGKNGSQNKSL